MQRIWCAIMHDMAEMVTCEYEVSGSTSKTTLSDALNSYDYFVERLRQAVEVTIVHRRACGSCDTTCYDTAAASVVQGYHGLVRGKERRADQLLGRWRMVPVANARMAAAAKCSKREPLISGGESAC